MWPPNFPDLNPIDYEVWGVLQRCLYRTRICNVGRPSEAATSRRIEGWRHFSQDIIDRAVRQWSARLRTCIGENGGHFEYKL